MLMDYAAMTFGQRCRWQRVRRNLTLEEVATATGIGSAYVSRLERGVEYDPQLSVLRRLAAALGTTVGSLCD